MGKDDSLAELQRRYKNGDAAAFEQLFRCLRRQCEKWVLRMTSWDKHLADEVFSEASVKLFDPRTRDRYAADQPWLPWASTALHHIAIDLHRRRARRREMPLDFDEPTARASPDGLRLDLEDALGRLPTDQRDLVVEHFINGKTQTEIAGERNRSTSGVNRDLHRALERLGELLRGYRAGG
jgi:RNA polymerase sigma factor (sigma-70 family)